MRVLSQTEATKSKLGFVSKVATLAMMALAAVVLVGWALGLRPLIELIPTTVVMNPVTASAFVLLGCGFWLSNWKISGAAAGPNIWSRSLGLVVVLLGLVRLLDHLLGAGLHVERLLFPAKLAAVGIYPLSEMAPNTALNLLLCGLALLCFNLEIRSGFAPAQAFILFAGWITMLALIGYTYRVLLFYRLGAGLPMSLEAAIEFALFVTGFVTAQPARGVMAMLTSRTTGGAVARRLIPMAVLIPWALGAGLLVLEQAGFYGKEFAMAFFAVSSIIVFTGLVWWNARLLHGWDLQRSEAEEQLRRAGAELKRSNTELQQFAYVASHDLFEPLRMITSYLQLLEQQCGQTLGPRGREFLQFALEGATRMDALIRDLLAYTRLEVHQRPFEPTDCERVFCQSVANLKVAIEESGTTVTHERLPTVRGDAVQLTQVFQNLIANAIKFRSDRPPRIETRAERRGAEWLFSVRDNGIGIDAKFFDRIFVIFQRLHTSQEYPGTGMGLAICKKIIERHGGRIWVQSAAGQGANFFFTLPA